MICNFCIEEREFFIAYFAKEIAPKSKWRRHEQSLHHREYEMKEVKDKMEDLYYRCDQPQETGEE